MDSKISGPSSAGPRYDNPAVAEILSSAVRRPLVSVWGAALLINCSEHRVEKMIEEGELEFAFDIRLPSAEKRAIRILTAGIWEHKSGQRISRTLDDAIGLILPRTRSTVFASELAFSFHCSSWHIYRLAMSQQFLCQGRLPAMRITVSSAENFLRGRRIL